MGRHGGGNGDRFDFIVVEKSVELHLGANSRISGLEPIERGPRSVAHCDQSKLLRVALDEIPRKVRPPIPETHYGHANEPTSCAIPSRSRHAAAVPVDEARRKGGLAK